MHTLYKLMFASGKSYIGQTTRVLRIRITAHRQSAKRGSMLPVHCAWRKHGDPEVIVIGQYQTHDELHAAEKAAIIAVNALVPHGYNVSIGGDTAPSKNPEVAAKISAKAKGRKILDVSAWVESSKEKWKDPEYRKKVSDGLKSAWTQQKREERGVVSKAAWEQRKANGYVVSESTRKKLASYERTTETRAKMSESAKTRKRAPRSEETKRKIAEKTRLTWQDPILREKLLTAKKEALERRRLGLH